MFHHQSFLQHKLSSLTQSFGVPELLLILAIIAVPVIAGIALALILLLYFRKREKNTD